MKIPTFHLIFIITICFTAGWLWRGSYDEYVEHQEHHNIVAINVDTAEQTEVYVRN